MAKVDVQVSSFGELLKKVRSKYGWSQEDLQHELREINCKVSLPTIGLWERDRNIPRANVILPIAEVTKVKAESILELLTYEME